MVIDLARRKATVDPPRANGQNREDILDGLAWEVVATHAETDQKGGYLHRVVHVRHGVRLPSERILSHVCHGRTNGEPLTRKFSIDWR